MFRPAKEELAQLADFQKRLRTSLLAVVCTELLGVARLKQQAGDAQAIRLLELHAQEMRDVLSGFPGGLEVSSGNGAFFLVFEKPSDAVRFALEIQERVTLLGRKIRQLLEQRIAVHVGEVLVEVVEEGDRPRGFNGIQVDICQAVLSIAGPGNILLTRFALESARQAMRSLSGGKGSELSWIHHGVYRIEGIDEPLEIGEVSSRSRRSMIPPTGNEKVRKIVVDDGVTTVAPVRSTFAERIKSWGGDERAAAIRGGILVAFVGMLLLGSGILDPLSYDLGFLLHGVRAPEGIAIVAMDDRSHRELSPEPSRPWDRRIHSRLLERLTRAGARAVAFDILFDSPSAQAVAAPGFVENPVDRDLREAMVRNGRVFLGAKLRPDGVEAPSPLFRSPGRWGLVEISSGSDVIRRPAQGFQDVPPLVEALAVLVHGKPMRRRESDWLNYYGPPGTVPTYSYLSALSPQEIPDAALSNKVIFVGEAATMPPARDEFASPYSRWRTAQINGVEVIATSYQNLVNGESLRRLNLWLEVTVLGILGFVLGFVLTLLEVPGVTVVGIVLSLVLGLVGMVLPGASDVWFPWLVLSGGQVPMAMAWSLAVRFHRTVSVGRSSRFSMGNSSGSLLPTTAMLPPNGPRTPTALENGLQSPAWDAGAATVVGGGASLGTNRSRERVVEASEETWTPERGGAIPAVPDHEMLRRIGSGAYGEVWLARDIIGNFKAVKIIRRSAFSDAGPFDREFRGLQKFTPISRSHPGLVHILHVGRNDPDGFFYYIMEAGDDVATGQRIVPESYQSRSLVADITRHGSIPLDRIVRHGIALAEALSHLHRHGLIHRDLKPANVIFVDDRPKLADIGLVTEIAAPGQEVTMVGTQGYIPMEGHGTPAGDIYSLGKLLYVAFAALPVTRFPEIPPAVFKNSPSSLREEFMRILNRACQIRDSDRYPDADTFLSDLRLLEARLTGS